MAEHTESAAVPEGATDWEAQEARNAWRNTLSHLDDTLARVASIRQAFLDADPNAYNHPLAVSLNNAAGRLTEAAHEAARWSSVCNGSVHRQAIDRQRREGQLDAARRVAAYVRAHDQLGANVDHELLNTVVVGPEAERYDLLAADLRALADAVEPF